MGSGEKRGVSMDRRLMKRHKRQVSRAKEHKEVSEPDVRTPEQIKAAREASRAPDGRSGGSAVRNVGAPVRAGHTQGTGSSAKTDV